MGELTIITVIVFGIVVIIRLTRQCGRLKKQIMLKNLVEKTLYQMTVTDDLTKLYNQRHFTKQLAKEIDRADRYDRPLCQLIIDLDNFKEVNDTQGHLVGDRMLESVGGAIQGSIRTVDIGCRSGGDEFSIILPETRLPDAEKVAIKVREAISGIIDVSIGVVELRPGENINSFLKRADDNMYTDKRSKGAA